MAKKKELTFQEQSNLEGHGFVESIKDDLDAVEHAQKCDGETEDGKPCKRGQETKRVKAGGKTYQQNVHNQPDVWHDLEQAKQVIRESHYGIQLRSGWYTPGEESPEPEEFTITIGGGGPASRVIGDLEDGKPVSAHYEFQNWFKPWTRAELSYEEEEIILKWAQNFYFGD